MPVEKSGRIMQPFLHEKTFVSKTQNRTWPYPERNWNINAQEVTTFTLISTPGISVAFLIWGFLCCRTPVTHHVQSSPPLENQVHCSDPAGSSITLKIKQFTFRKWRSQRIKKPNPNLTGCAKVKSYSPASVKVVQNMQIAIYCSCPQDSDTVKVILLTLQQQKNWWNHFKSVVRTYTSSWARFLGEGHNFQITLCQNTCLIWALC